MTYVIIGCLAVGVIGTISWRYLYRFYHSEIGYLLRSRYRFGVSKYLFEVVDLPKGFPNCSYNNSADVGTLGAHVESRPSVDQAPGAVKQLARAMAAGAFISDYDTEWLYKGRASSAPMLLKLFYKYKRSKDIKEERHKREFERFLWMLQVPQAFGWVVNSLKVEGEERVEILGELQSFVSFRHEYSPLICNDDLKALLISFVSEAATREDALIIICNLQLPEAAELILQVASEPGKFPHHWPLTKMKWTAVQAEKLIESIESRLGSESDEKSVENLLGTLGIWVDQEAPSELKAKAISVTEAYFLNPQNPYRMKALAALKKSGSEACLQEAERLAFSEKNGDALFLYARLAKEHIRPDFIDFLNAPGLGWIVLQTLAKLPEAAIPKEWIEPIAALLKDPNYQEAAVAALAHMGPPGWQEVKKVVRKVPTSILWKEQGLTLEKAADDLLRLKLVDQRPVIDPKLDIHDPANLISLFSSIMHCFDGEHDFIPPPHHELVLKLSKCSRGKLEVLHPQQRLRSTINPMAGFIVLFQHNGKLVRFSTHFLHDWYETESVIYSLNKLLKLDGHHERFIGVDWGHGQVASYVFGEKSAVETFSEEYGMKLIVQNETGFEENYDLD